MFTRSFWTQALERAIKTAAQAALALLTLHVAAPPSLLAIDWPGIGAAAVLAALVSVLTSLVSASVGPADSPSVVDVDGAAGDVHVLEWSAEDFPPAPADPHGDAPLALLRADQSLAPEALQQLADEWLAQYASGYAARHALREDDEPYQR